MRTLVAAQTKAVSTCERCPSSVVTTILRDYIPAFRFGVLSECRAVSISINPAENQDGSRSLPCFSEFGLPFRSALTDANLAEVARRSDEYFAAGCKHRFFNTLASLVSSIDPTWSYESGTLSHIDLVACVTRPKWTMVPAQQRQAMLAHCRNHFLKTIRLLSAECWLLCDGRTVLQAVEDLGGRTERAVRLGAKVTVLIGNLALDGTNYRYLGWSRPAHKLYAVPAVVGSAVKRLMTGDPEVPHTESQVGFALDATPPSSCVPDGRFFTKQRDLMRFLVGELGHDQVAVCREYAAAEHRGLVQRKGNGHGLSAAQYASRLYADGVGKGWLR